MGTCQSGIVVNVKKIIKKKDEMTFLMGSNLQPPGKCKHKCNNVIMGDVGDMGEAKTSVED